MVCSDKLKLDKIDKIGISIIFIFATIFCFFDTFCFGFVAGTQFNNHTVNIVDDKYVITEVVRAFGAYYPLEVGKTYKMTYSGDMDLRLCFTETEPSAGVEVNGFLRNAPNGYVFTAETDNAFLFTYDTSSRFNMENIKIEEFNGMQTTLYNLIDNIGSDSFFGVFETAIPFLLIIVLASLAFYIIFRLFSGISKGKARL